MRHDRQWQGGVGGLDDLLQVYPTRTAIYGAERARLDVSRRLASHWTSDKLEADEPIGPLIGVLLSVDEKWIPGDKVEFGPWSIEPLPTSEHFFSLIPLAHWAKMQSLEFRVHGLRRSTPPRFLPAVRPKSAYEGVGSQAADWHASTAPSSAFADGVRGFEIHASDSAVKMDWFHRGDGHVFSEVGGAGYLRTVMVRHHPDVAGAPQWKRADRTPFEGR